MLSPILHPASGVWTVGYIRNHTAKPMSREEIEAHIKEVAALRADKARLDWLEEHCEVMASTACAGSPLVEHNAFLNPDHAGKLRVEIDEARATYPVPPAAS
jgi:hypothetical protein